MFKAQTGIDILHVPYKGGADHLPGIVTGRVDVHITRSVEDISLRTL
jgi:tripartite-type tricarboxylate transporter receptor subunit TctC